MRKITIVGAGQFGLHLGIALLRQGYSVTIATNRTGEEIRNGRILSSQILFGPVLEMEHTLGLNHWELMGGRSNAASFSVSMGQPEPMMSWVSPMPPPGGQSVDQRLKMPVWMDLFVREGGNLLIQDVGVRELEALADDCELLIVAAGKAEIANLFERDTARSEVSKPLRHLAMVYVNGMKPHKSGLAPASYVQAPGVGEYVTFPCVTLNGPGDILMFESVIDGPMHQLLKDAKSVDEVLTAGKAVLGMIAPWEIARCENVKPTDPLASLSGAVTPGVRKPFAQLPSGKTIMGGGDVVVLNDPLTGQGANNASKHADVVLRAILERGGRPFDSSFMQKTFEIHWSKAQWVSRFTNFMLQPQEPLVTLMTAMTQQPRLQREFLRGFMDASTFSNWLFEPAEATQKIAACA